MKYSIKKNLTGIKILMNLKDLKHYWLTFNNSNSINKLMPENEKLVRLLRDNWVSAVILFNVDFQKENKSMN